MQETECPQCGDFLSVPPEFADRPVRCGSCGRVIQPHERDRRRSSAPPPPPARGGTAPRFPDEETDPELRTPRRRSNPRVLLWVVLALVGVGFVGCGGVALLGLVMANPAWRTHTEEGVFAADFPGEPIHDSDPIPLGDKTGTPSTLEKFTAARMENGERFHVWYVNTPKNQSGKDVMNAILGSFRLSPEIGFQKTAEPKKVTVDGYKGEDIEGTVDLKEYGPGFGYARGLVVGDRVFVLIALGKDQKPLARHKDQFFKSFKPVAGTGEDKKPEKKK